MRKSAALFSGVLVVIALVAPAFAKTETITGQLVDLACFGLNKEDAGNAHKGKGYICGQACAREGFPVGLVTSDGKVYEVKGDLAANSNAKLVPHIAQRVTITGDVSEQDGVVFIRASDLMATKN